MTNIKNKGFSLIELLAVIVILGLLMAIAIPSVTKYITQSRKKTTITTIKSYIRSVETSVNDMEYIFTNKNVIYGVPTECIAVESGGKDPLGNWELSNNTWSYVLVQYNDLKPGYTYGFTFKDSSGYGLYPVSDSSLNTNGKQIRTGLNLKKTESGLIGSLTEEANWSGFEIDSDTYLLLLQPAAIGNGTTTCTAVNGYEDDDERTADSFQGFKKNKNDLQYDGDTALMLSTGNQVPTKKATPDDSNYNNEYSIDVTVKGTTNQIGSPSGGYAATILAISEASENYVCWFGYYNNYLNIHSFRKAGAIGGRTKEMTDYGFGSFYIGDQDNKKVNIQITGKRGGQTKVYINGVLKFSFASGNDDIHYKEITLGDLRLNRGLKFNGSIYDVKTYDRVLSDSEIQTNYNKARIKYNI